MFTVEKRSKDTVREIITPAIKDRAIKIEGLKVHIENTQKDIVEYLPTDLADGRIDQETYDMQLNQAQQDLQRITKGHADLVQMVERLNKINKGDGDTDCFVISATTSRDELKKLIELAKVQLTLTEDKEERVFLSALLQPAESRKTALDEGRTPETKSITLLQSETKYASSLLEQMKDYEFNKPKSEVIDNYLKKIEELDTLKNQATFDPKVSEIEKTILYKLCDNINKEVKETLQDLINPTAVVNEDKFQENALVHLEKSLEQAKKIPVTTGFKGFINDICEFINVKPAFTVSSKNLIDQMKSMKDSLQVIKEESTELEEGDENTRLLGHGSP